MNISYDYEELIRELNEEIAENTLKPEDTIQILRGENIGPVTHFGEIKIIAYKPIIDWYFDKPAMDDLLAPEPAYLQHDGIEEERLKMMDDYKRDSTSLQPITVKECLAEMESMSRIL